MIDVGTNIGLFFLSIYLLTLHRLTFSDNSIKDNKINVQMTSINCEQAVAAFAQLVSIVINDLFCGPLIKGICVGNRAKIFRFYILTRINKSC